jgi:hypothetical protein
MIRWTCLPSSSATMLPHTFNTSTKIIEFGHTPTCCICPNSFSASTLAHISHVLISLCFKWSHLEMTYIYIYLFIYCVPQPLQAYFLYKSEKCKVRKRQ